MPPVPVILDCDPGQDDAVAILLALAAPEEIHLLAVTTVAGNVPLALTARNARAVVELSERRVPVYAGCPRPLLVPPIDAAHIHGDDGLNGANLPPPCMPLGAEHAVDLIRRRLREAAAGSVTLCAIGPLTNIAVALVQEPAIRTAIARVVLMGGAIGLGNTTPAAEFNIHADPHAAAIVFASGVPIVMAPLELTYQALATPERIAAIDALGTPVGRTVAAILRTYPTSQRFQHRGGPLHDPCAVGYILWPELMRGRHVHVAVETEGRATLGRTVVDWWGKRAAPNAIVLDQLDADAFFTRLTERLARLVPRPHPGSA